MNTRHVQASMILTLIAGAAAGAAAAESPWSMSILGGDSVGTSGSLRSSGITNIADLGSVSPGLAGNAGTLSLGNLRYEDLYKRRYDTGLELDYSFNDNLQSFGRFNYEGLGGRSRTLGELASPSLAAPAAVTARFSNVDNTSWNLGSRYFWSTGSDWRPFAGAALGVTHLDAMRASIASPDASFGAQNVRFTRSGEAFSQSLETGVEYDPRSSFGVRLSLDAQHVGSPPNADDPVLASLGLNAANDAERRWSFPVSLAATYHF